MNRRHFLVLGLLACLLLPSQLLPGLAPSARAQTSDPDNTLVMELTYGKVVIAMRPDRAPKTVARIKELVRKGFYDGIVFPRVIRVFLAQNGDTTGNGRAEESRAGKRSGRKCR